MPSAAADSSPPKCCCCRVDEAAKIIAWISIVLLAMAFGLQFYEPPEMKSNIYGRQKTSDEKLNVTDVSFWVCPFYIGIYAFVLIGCNRRKAAYFLPFLIITAIAMIFGLIGLIFVAISGPLPGFLILLLAHGINFWIYWVFYKAYKFIKEEQNGVGQNQLPIFYQQPAQNPNAGGILMVQNGQERKYYPVQAKN